VTDVAPLSPAARGQVQPGDIILSVNDKEVSNVNDVTKALDGIQAGHTARIHVWRPDDKDEYSFTLRKR
jgi:S1-C subfamily serine protease